MANDNNIQLDIEISDKSVEGAFKVVDERAGKSAKTSAIAFEVEFQKQEQLLKSSIQKLTNESKEYVRKSAMGSAEVFQQAFSKQNNIYKASVKQNIDNAIGALTNSNGIKKAASESASVFEDAFRKESASFKSIALPQANSGSLGVLPNAAASVYLLKTAYDLLKTSIVFATEQLVFGGEKILKTEARFAALATSVGIVSDSFKNELAKSINGFIDDTETMRFASEAFVRIGSAAKDLPGVFEAARKSYQVFGGEILDNANRIISAAETGSKRTLKDIGLYTDLEGAVKKYAKQIGTIPSLLTDQQKEQARLNAILIEAENRFGAVQVKAGAVSAYTQLKTALNDLGDEFQKLGSSKLGKVFQGIAEAARSAVDGVTEAIKRSRPADTIAEMTTRLDALKRKQAEYETQLVALGSGASLALGANLKGQLVTIKDQIAAYEELRRKTAQVQATKFQDGKDKTPRDTSKDAEIEAAKAAAGTRLIELNKTLIQSEIQLAQDEQAIRATRAGLETIYYNQKLLAAATYNTQRTELDKTLAENGTVTEEQRMQAIELLEDTHFNNRLKLQQDYNAKVRALTNEGSIDVVNYADMMAQVLEGAANATKFQFASIKAGLQDLGKAFVTTFKDQATKAIFAFAQGSKNASEAAQGLFTGILNAMGEMLISQGLGFILQGAAFTYAGMPNGPLLIKAGAGMLAFGATLAAVSAANGGKVGAESGGGTAGSDAYLDNRNNDNQAPIVDTKPENPNTTVNVNVGQVFDRKETGMWIADVLTETFEQNGIVIRGNS